MYLNPQASGLPKGGDSQAEPKSRLRKQPSAPYRCCSGGGSPGH